MNNLTILKDHISPETAYIVADYPYGFRLRCQIRYWLEYKPGKGIRCISQTSNPKKPGLVWNKPKASTYCRFGGALWLDAAGHVQFAGLTPYCDFSAALAWFETYRHGVPEDMFATLAQWVNRKAEYARQCGRGEISFRTAINGVEQPGEVVKLSEVDALALKRFDEVHNGKVAAFTLR